MRLRVVCLLVALLPTVVNGDETLEADCSYPRLHPMRTPRSTQPQPRALIRFHPHTEPLQRHERVESATDSAEDGKAFIVEVSVPSCRWLKLYARDRSQTSTPCSRLVGYFQPHSPDGSTDTEQCPQKHHQVAIYNGTIRDDVQMLTVLWRQGTASQTAVQFVGEGKRLNGESIHLLSRLVFLDPGPAKRALNTPNSNKATTRRTTAKPTPKPTTKPTTKPTSKTTPKPTTKPTTKPTSKTTTKSATTSRSTSSTTRRTSPPGFSAASGHSSGWLSASLCMVVLLSFFLE